MTGSTLRSNAVRDVLDNRNIKEYVGGMKNGATIKHVRVLDGSHKQTRVIREPLVSYKTKPWPRWLQWLMDLVDEMEARR